MVFSYVSTLRTFLMLFLFSLPMVLVGEYGWLAAPGITLIAYLFLNIEQMALEIEQPFGDDPNDLPMEGYLLELEAELISMLPGNIGHNPLPEAAPTTAGVVIDDSDDEGPASPLPHTRKGGATSGATAAGPGGYQRLQEADTPGGMDEGAAAAMMV